MLPESINFPQMSYELLKALHIVFTTLWFSGLFGFFWLFILHRNAMAEEPAARDVLVSQYRSMRRGLAAGVLWPCALLSLATVAAVLWLPSAAGPIPNWPAAKASLNLLMLLLQIALVAHSHKLRHAAPTLSAWLYRALMLVPLALLVGSSFLDIQLSPFSWMQGAGVLFALIGLSALLLSYLRRKNPR
jgi:uncharacterized membrane protein